MEILAALILLVIGFVTGALTTLARVMVVARKQQLAAPQPLALPTEQVPEPQPEPAAEVPVFLTPITLDADRVIEAGFTQAYQAGVARIARLN